MKKTALLVGLILATLISVAQVEEHDYKQEWGFFDDLIQKNLIQDCNNKLDKIAQWATEEQNDEQLFRTQYERARIIAQYNENRLPNAIFYLDSLLETAQQPYSNIFNFLIAECLTIYQTENFAIINDRTHLANTNLQKFESWSNLSFTHAITNYFLKALNNLEVTAQMESEKFDFLLSDKKTFRYLRPTIFDVITQFFLTSIISINDNQYIKELIKEHPQLLQPCPKFLKVDVELITKNSNLNTQVLFTILQNVFQYHFDSLTNKDIIIDYELLKLNYLKKFLEDNDLEENSQYFKTLELLENKYKDETGYASILFQKALFYFELLKKTEKQNVKEYVQKSKNIFEILKTNYNSKNALFYLGILNEKELTSRGNETYYTFEKNLLVPVTYKNLDSIYLSVYKIDPKDYAIKSFSPYGKNKNIDSLFFHYLKFNENSELIKTELIYLINPYDFQKHSTDILLQNIEIGNYYLVFHLEKEIDEKNILTCIRTIATQTKINILANNVQCNFTAVDLQTGKPIPKVKIQFTKGIFDNILFINSSKTTNLEGNCKIRKYSSTWLFDTKVRNGEDVYESNNILKSSAPSRHQWRRSRSYNNSRAIQIYTDRAIYRPGQTVYFKAVYYGNHKVLKNRKVLVEFKNDASKNIESYTLKTNRFGSIDSCFQIPANSNTGNFAILLVTKDLFQRRALQYVKVEEYKRPTFEIEFEKLQKEFRLGDSVEITGFAKAYSGAVVSNANVKYEIIPSDRTMETLSGEVVTDRAGKFIINFETKKPTVSYMKSVNYSIKVDITDINGETQSKAKSIYLSNETISFLHKMEDINLFAYRLLPPTDTLSVKVGAFNADLNELSCTISAQIEQLQFPEQIYLTYKTQKPDYPILTPTEYQTYFRNFSYDEPDTHRDRWKVFKTVLSQTFNSIQDSLKITDRNWEVGEYRLILSTMDRNNDLISDTSYFKVFDFIDTKPPIYSALDVQLSSNYIQQGEILKIGVSTILQNAWVHCIIQKNNRLKRSFWLNINQEQKVVDYKVRKTGKGYLSVFATITQNGETYEADERAFIPKVPKKISNHKRKRYHLPLNIEAEHITNPIVPGEEERWRFKIDNLYFKKRAEVLALMYDCSLDKFATNYFLDFRYSRLYRSIYRMNFETESLRLFKEDLIFNIKQIPVLTSKQYETLSLFHKNNNYSRYQLYTFTRLGNMWNKELSNNPFFPDSEFMNNYHFEEVVVYYVPPVFDRDNTTSFAKLTGDEVRKTPGHSVVDGITTRGNSSPSISSSDFDELEDMDYTNSTDYLPFEFSQNIRMRKNFNETSFFFPKLLTDKKGNFVVEFTAPESLTQWKFFALAHTKDKRVGRFQAYFQTRQTLMLMPNRPRFLREMDTMAFSIKIVNLSDSLVSGKAKIEFFNADNNFNIDILLDNKTQVQDFNCDKNTVVEWWIAVPKNISAISYKVVAQAGNYSDGEEYTFPVLPNRSLITESLLLYVKGKSSKSFTFEKLQTNSSTTLEHFSYTLEFTTNPVWYAIQSLPYLMEYRYDCNEQIFSKLYANAVIFHIAQSNPNIKTVFESWNEDNSETSKSNLYQNEELKNIVLEETPWVREAQNQSERLKKLGVLFNLKQTENEISRLIGKLNANQNRDGSWGWFADMDANLFITQHIVAGFGHLKALGIEIPYNKLNLDKAQEYLDNKHLKAYQDRLKDSIPYLFNNIDAHYLYARSFDFDSTFIKQPFVQQYLNEAKKEIYQRDLYTQVLLALTFHRLGMNELAQDIMESVRQQAFKNEEMGMYWKTNNPGRYYSWYEAPIERQALFIEAFTEIKPNADDIEMMKLWLIKQKQTQAWANTKATAEASFALLLRGTDLILEDNDVNIKIGEQSFNPNEIDDIEAGTGYFKRLWQANEITPQMAQIELHKQSEGSAYGALYWQYFEDLDKITSANTELSIEKRVYKIIVTPNGEELQEITENEPLKIGDKVMIRMLLKTDRDLEYVHLKDQRASALEPMNVLTSTKYQNGLRYIESTRDAATNFFIPYLAKGNYVFEYRLVVAQKGEFSNGIATIQCMYAPEFSAHSEGMRILVK